MGTRERVALSLAVAAASLLVCLPAAHGGFIVHQVTLLDPPEGDSFMFDPDRLSIVVGPSDQVNFERGDESDARHNVRELSRLFYSGPPTTGPINFTTEFSAGTFRYYCEVHGSPGRGMDGVVRVAPQFDSDPGPGSEFTVRWASDETELQTGNAFDVRYRRQGASGWTRWKNDTRARRGVFGANGRPETAVFGRTYEFQARSEVAGSDRRSGWSPVLVAEPTP